MSSTSHSSSQFDPVGPVRLHVENGKGTVEVTARETSGASVDVTGPDADDVRVELVGNDLFVIAPQHRGGFLGGDRRLDIDITVPLRSDLDAKVGSAALTGHGELGTVSVRSGSGDVRLERVSGSALVETGSGDLSIEHVEEALRVKSGSGDVAVRRSASEVSISTGSGDVRIDECHGSASVKTGSGDLSVGEARGDVGFSSGSGDLAIRSISAGRVQLKGASSDLRVGIPAGVPVWTDLSTISGRIGSSLQSAGEPGPGADHVEIRAKVVSGDLSLHQV